MKWRYRCSSMVLSGLLLLLTGCGGGLNAGGEVTGKVTLDGVPVTAGNVLLVSEDGQYSVAGPIRGDGTYLVKEPPLGKCKIAVQTKMFARQVKAPSGQQKSDPKTPGMVLPDPSERGLVYKEIPARYEEVETANLSCEIKRGNSTYNITLTRQ